MKRYRLTIIATVVLVTALLALWLAVPKQTLQAPSPTISTQSAKPATVAELLKLVNEERTKAGVAPLVLDERLNQSAQRKADDMVKYDYNDHVSPHDGKHGYEYINDVGISCKTDSENLYWGNTVQYPNTSIGAVTWWMSSKPHHDAMLNKLYTQTGIGISGTKIVEHFCEL